jgi:iron-regulated transporter 1
MIRTLITGRRFEIVCLVPTVICLYIGAGGKHNPTPSVHGSTVNVVIFFTSLALSRIGLYSFDLIQLQSMQVALERHPRRNKFTALQISMQSAFDLGKYVVVFVLNRPEE